YPTLFRSTGSDVTREAGNTEAGAEIGAPVAVWQEIVIQIGEDGVHLQLATRGDAAVGAVDIPVANAEFEFRTQAVAECIATLQQGSPASVELQRGDRRGTGNVGILNPGCTAGDTDIRTLALRHRRGRCQTHQGGAGQQSDTNIHRESPWNVLEPQRTRDAST